MIATLGMGGPAPSQRAAASGVATVPWTAATAIKVGGAAVTATVRAPASRARLRFKLARTTTVAVTFVSWTFPADGATSAFLADHSGKEIRALRALDGTGPWDARPVRLRAGTYFVVVDTGRSRDSGSVKVQLTAVGAIAANGRAVTVSIGRTQQPRLLAFTARAGSTVVVGATRAAFNAGHGATLGIENGSGIPQAPVTFAGGPIGPVHTAATVRATGRYYVAFRPAVPGSRGSARLTLHVVRPQATAVIGGRAVSVRTTAPGVPALVSFTARARESIAVVAHSTTFSGYAARFYVTTKNGVQIGPEQYLAKSKAAVGPVHLPSAGRYTVVIDPGQDRTAGGVRLSLIKVTEVRLHTTIGGRAVTAVIRQPTQQAIVTFRARAKQQVLVKFAGSTFGSPADTIQLDGPRGTTIDPPISLNARSGQLRAAKLARSGTYSVLIDPSFTGDAGKVTVTVRRAAAAVRPRVRPAPARHLAVSSPRPATAPASGPVFTVRYNFFETDIFTDGPGQGYDNTSDISANWSQSPDGSVTGQATLQNTGHTWLYNDVCIIARLSDSHSSGQFSGPLLAGEAFISPGLGSSASYKIIPGTIIFNSTKTTQNVEYDTPVCHSGESVSTDTFETTIFPGPLTGSIPPGRTSASGHSSCGTGVTITKSIGTLVQVVSCSLDWSITVPPSITCQTAMIRLPATNAPAGLRFKPVRIEYGALPLTFTSAPTDPGSLCTLKSNFGTLPVYLKYLGVPSFTARVDNSITQATLDFFPADDPATFVPACDFSKLQALQNPFVTPSSADFNHTNDCLTTPTSHASGGIIVRWSIPGFSEYAPNGTKITTTAPHTYFLDLSAIPGAPGTESSFQDVVQSAETYFHVHLIDNLPDIDRIGILQDPPAQLLITDPLGRTVGFRGRGKVVTFPGAGYAKAGGRSIAWILEPVPGAYHVTAIGPSGVRFHSEFTVLQFLGHGTRPLMKNTTWRGRLGHGGTARRTFGVRGESLTPVVRPHENRTRVKRRAPVRFSLAGSVLPFRPVKVIWRFGDGAKAKGATVTHRFKKAGNYVVRVTVTNSLGFKTTVRLRPIVVTR